MFCVCLVKFKSYWSLLCLVSRKMLVDFPVFLCSLFSFNRCSLFPLSSLLFLMSLASCRFSLPFISVSFELRFVVFLSFFPHLCSSLQCVPCSLPSLSLAVSFPAQVYFRDAHVSFHQKPGRPDTRAVTKKHLGRDEKKKNMGRERDRLISTWFLVCMSA